MSSNDENNSNGLPCVGPSLPSPLPDHRSANRNPPSHSPHRQVRRYLAHIKNSRQAEAAPSPGRSKQVEGASSSRTEAEEVLRRRIDELERENNEYRHCVMEYQRLAERNAELEQQMVMLCQEIEQQQQEQPAHGAFESVRPWSERGDSPGVKMERFRTTESEEFDSSAREGAWRGVRMAESVEPFRPGQLESPEHLLRQENEVLRQENKRIKEEIDRNIQEAIAKMTEQFNLFMSQLSQQGQAAKAQPSSRPSSPRERQQSVDRRSDSLRISQSGGGYSFDLRPVEEEGASNSEDLPIIREKNDSIIRIDLSERSDSSEGQVAVNQQHSSSRQAEPTRSQQNRASSESGPDSRDLARAEEVFVLLREVRGRIDGIMGGGSAVSDLPRRIEKELKDIIVSYFFKGNEGLLGHSDNLLSESIQMRNKIQDLNQEISQLRHELRLRVDESFPRDASPRPASERYLESSYYHPLRQERAEFEATKKKLLYVIEVMRGFNEEYRQLLGQSGSAREGLLSGR